MTALAESTGIDALPWPYVVALCSALGGGILVMWKRDVAREAERIAREKSMADQARTDGAAVATALASASANMRETTEMIRLLVSRVDLADRERHTLADEIVEKLDTLTKTVDGCRLKA